MESLFNGGKELTREFIQEISMRFNQHVLIAHIVPNLQYDFLFSLDHKI